MTKVLLIDDARFALIRIEGMLSSKGYEVITASDGLSALNLFMKNQPDITFCDIEMPEMNGLEVLKEIKRMDAKHPVIMLTGHSERELVMQAKEGGASGYLMKPFEPEDIIAKIKQFIQ